MTSTTQARDLPPTVEELALLGFTRSQVAMIGRLPSTSSKWAVHDEMIRRLMSADDSYDDGLFL
jgi:hypothetical protein